MEAEHRGAPNPTRAQQRPRESEGWKLPAGLQGGRGLPAPQLPRCLPRPHPTRPHRPLQGLLKSPLTGACGDAVTRHGDPFRIRCQMREMYDHKAAQAGPGSGDRWRAQVTLPVSAARPGLSLRPGRSREAEPWCERFPGPQTNQPSPSLGRSPFSHKALLPLHLPDNTSVFINLTYSRGACELEGGMFLLPALPAAFWKFGVCG